MSKAADDYDEDFEAYEDDFEEAVESPHKTPAVVSSSSSSSSSVVVVVVRQRKQQLAGMKTRLKAVTARPLRQIANTIRKIQQTMTQIIRQTTTVTPLTVRPRTCLY